MKRLIWNKHTKLLLKHAAGWFCLVIGMIMLVTPGQGILSILTGVYLLADEIPLFGRIRTCLEHHFPKTADFVRLKKEQFKEKMRRHEPTDETQD